MSIRLLIADDHPLIRAGLPIMLEGSGIEIVGVLGSAEATEAQYADIKPDVILMDVRMPDDDGLLALDKIRAQSPNTKVVMFSAWDNMTFVARAVALGALDYVLKSCPREDLVMAIKNAAAGVDEPVGKEFKRIQMLMSRIKRMEPVDGTRLSPRELQVATNIALGLSNREIGFSMGISVETVKEHVQNVLRKIPATDRTAAAVWVIKQGLMDI